MAWQQQGYGQEQQNFSGEQGYGQGQQYGQQQFNQHQQYATQVLSGQTQQGYNQGNQNWKTGPANMNAGPGHFGASNSVRFLSKNVYLFVRIQTTAMVPKGTAVMEGLSKTGVGQINKGAEDHVKWVKTRQKKISRSTQSR